jgi:long-chain acyl-CoA synthetase
MTPPRDVPRSIPHQLEEQADLIGERPALWTRRHGRWGSTTWKDYADKVRWLGIALGGLGLQPGGKVVLWAGNREEWVVGAVAVMGMGGTPVGLYGNSSPEQVQYITHHCEAAIAIVEGEPQLAALRTLKAQLPDLRHLVVMEPPTRLEDDEHAFAELLSLGQVGDDAVYYERLNALRPDELATLIYTSGTTGNPKGVMLSHRNVCWTAARLADALEFDQDAVNLSYLPLSHIAEQMATIYGPAVVGGQVYFSPSMEETAKLLPEVRPTLFLGVPRVWEKLKGKIEEGMAALPPRRRRVAQWARAVVRERNERELRRDHLPATLEVQYALAKRLVIFPLKLRLGFDRTRLFVTAAAPIGRDVLDFLASLDIVLQEVYGQSEGAGPTTVATRGYTRFGTAGRPLLGVEVKLGPDGEIWVRGENVCQGYFKEPAATAELLEGGWLHSGDLGEFDPEGFLRLTGRKKEILVTSGGKKTDPAQIETLLKGLSPVGNAMVVGEGRKYLVALLALDPEKARALAQARGWPQELESLAGRAELVAYLQDRIDREVNSRLARFEGIKRIAVLPHDFSVEGGELTPTLKLRRKPAAEKYRALIEALYALEAPTAAQA